MLDLSYTKENVHSVTSMRRSELTAEHVEWLQNVPKRLQSTGVRLSIKSYEGSHQLAFTPSESTLRGRLWTFAINRDVERVKRVVEALDAKWAHITHDKDPGVEPHTHFYIDFKNARFLNPLAHELDLPPNMLEKVRSKKDFLEYLTHKDETDKYHYDPADISANFDVETEIEVLDVEQKRSFLWDTLKLHQGRISVNDYLLSHQDKLCQMGYGAVYRVAADIAKISRDDYGNLKGGVAV